MFIVYYWNLETKITSLITCSGLCHVCLFLEDDKNCYKSRLVVLLEETVMGLEAKFPFLILSQKYVQFLS